MERTLAERNVRTKLLEITKERYSYIRYMHCNSRLVNIPDGFYNKCVNFTTKLHFHFSALLHFRLSQTGKTCCFFFYRTSFIANNPWKGVEVLVLAWKVGLLFKLRDLHKTALAFLRCRDCRFFLWSNDYRVVVKIFRWHRK